MSTTEKSNERSNKIRTAISKHQEFLKKSVLLWITTELNDCKLVDRIVNRGVRKQFLYRRKNTGPLSPDKYHDIYKEVPTLDAFPIEGEADALAKMLEEIGMRKCPGSGWNVGTKVYINIIFQQAKGI